MKTEDLLVVLAMTGLSIGIHRSTDEKEVLIYGIGIISILLGMMIHLFRECDEIGDYQPFVRMLTILIGVITAPFIPHILTFIKSLR